MTLIEFPLLFLVPLLPLLGVWVVLQRVVFLGITLAQVAAAGVVVGKIGTATARIDEVQELLPAAIAAAREDA